MTQADDESCTRPVSPVRTIEAKYRVGQVVRHRVYPFRGVIYDVDPQFSNTEEWWAAIPEAVRPARDQPFYHLFAENAETAYLAYVSEQNLVPDEGGQPIRHPQVKDFFASRTPEGYALDRSQLN